MSIVLNGTTGITTPGLTNSGSSTVSGNTTFSSSSYVGIGLTPTSRDNAHLQLIDGIAFPATQVSSSDANVLDDYEEGTWTPNVYNAGASSTFTGKVGWYRKVGSLVTCWFCCDYGNTGGGGGQLYVSGLPFSMMSGLSQNPAWGIWGCNSTSPSNGNFQAGGGTQMQLMLGGNGNGATYTFISGMISYPAT